MGIFIGVDPDMHDLALACVNEAGKLLYACTITVPNTLKEHQAITRMARKLYVAECFTKINLMSVDAYAVEAQELYLSGPSRTPNPRNILHLASVTGAAIASLTVHCARADCLFPLPTQWKGNVPKGVHHARILNRAGIPTDKLVPMGGKEPYYAVREEYRVEGRNFPMSSWYHVNDAIGLAQYAAEQYQKKDLKQRCLERNRNGIL